MSEGDQYDCNGFGKSKEYMFSLLLRNKDEMEISEILTHHVEAEHITDEMKARVQSNIEHYKETGDLTLSHSTLEDCQI